MRATILAAVLCVIPSRHTLGQPIEVILDSGDVSVTVCVNSPLGGEVCDVDQSTVSGSTDIELDAYDVPTEILLHDFHLSLDQTMNFVINFGALGTITADIQNATVDYAQPGVPFGPSPLLSDAFTFLDVPTNPSGTANYSVPSGTLICVFLTNSGVPCAAALDLSQQGTVLADSISGEVTVNGNVLDFRSDLDLTVPLESKTTTIGSLRMTGSVHGTATLPSSLPGDIDGDGDVDLIDFASFSACFGLSAPEPPTCDAAAWNASDMDGNGIVNLVDFNTFATNIGT